MCVSRYLFHVKYYVFFRSKSLQATVLSYTVKENEELSLVEVLIIWSTYSSENTKKLLDTKRHGHMIDTSKKKKQTRRDHR